MKQHIALDAVYGIIALAAIGFAGNVTLRNSSAKHERTGYDRQSVSQATSRKSTSSVLGDASAPINLIEFSDFECPFCRALHATLTQLQARYPHQIRVSFRHYPISVHNFAFAAAVAAECAGDVGKFQSFADLVFSKQDSLAHLAWTTLAYRAGIRDTVRFAQCETDKTISARVQTDISDGARLKIGGTPLLIVGDHMVLGAPPIDTIEALMREAKMNPVSR